MGIDYVKDTRPPGPVELDAELNGFDAELAALGQLHRILMEFDDSARERMLAYLRLRMRADGTGA